jgi:hypothetical protein
MTSTDESSAAPADHVAGDRKLRPGIKLLLVSLLLVVMALGLFVYALGMALPSEDPPPVKRFPLAISIIGFGLSSLLFWLAFLQLAKGKR